MHIVRRLYLPLLILLCALWAFVPLEGGDDFWAHAAIGRIFLDTGHIPKQTVYLWSADVPWVFHAYGSGIIYASLLTLGGARVGPWLCLALNFALAVAPLLLVWRHAKYRAGEVPLLLVCLFVPALWFSSVRWRLRPEGFTVLFLTLTLLFLAQKKRARWQYFAIAAMFALWPNLHGGVLVGILVLWVGAISELVQPFLTPSERPLSSGVPLASVTEPVLRPSAKVKFNSSLFGLASICSVLPLVCNPWGLGYRTVFAGTAATSSHIAEWRHFWVYPQMNYEVAWGLCALCLVASVVWCLDRQKRAAIGAGLLLLTALWLQARRQIWLTSVTCMVALAQSAPVFDGERLYAALKRQKEARLDELMRIIAQAGVLLILVCACVVNLPTKGIRAIGTTAPLAMSQFLLTQAPKGRTFNDYEYSAALEWFLNNKRPLYIDLINAYPPELFDEWYEVAHASDDGKRVLDTKKIDVVALRPINNKNEDDPIYKLSKFMESSPQWKRIYDGVDGRVWARRKLYNAPVRFSKDLNSFRIAGKVVKSSIN